MTAEPLESSGLLADEACFPALAPLRLVPPGPDDLAAAGLPPDAHHFVQAVVEVVAGDRSALQLLACTAPRVYASIVRRARLGARLRRTAPSHPRPRARVVSVKVSQPRPGAAEVATRVQHGDRSHALAVRLEVNGERWICTALEWG